MFEEYLTWVPFGHPGLSHPNFDLPPGSIRCYFGHFKSNYWDTRVGLVVEVFRFKRYWSFLHMMQLLCCLGARSQWSPGVLCPLPLILLEGRYQPNFIFPHTPVCVKLNKISLVWHIWPERRSPGTSFWTCPGSYVPMSYVSVCL